MSELPDVRLGISDGAPHDDTERRRPRRAAATASPCELSGGTSSARARAVRGRKRSGSSLVFSPALRGLGGLEVLRDEAGDEREVVAAHVLESDLLIDREHLLQGGGKPTHSSARLRLTGGSAETRAKQLLELLGGEVVIVRGAHMAREEPL